ncbi:hypothetical protein KCU78_g17030, partial [Aureobasidium melanogenum]
MSYGNERYGGGDDGDYSRRNEGNYGGRDEYGGDNRGDYGRGGRQEFGNSQGGFGDQGYGGQSGGYGQGNPEHGRHHRRDDESGYDERRDDIRNHAQSGYGSVSGPGGYGRGQEGYGGPGDRVSSDNPESRYGSGYNEGDRFNGRNNDGGYGGRNDDNDRRYGGGNGGYGGGNNNNNEGRYGGGNDNEGRYGGGNGSYGGGNGGHGHSSGTSYGNVPGGSDDYSSAAHTAAQHAGDSGDSNLFSNALGMLSGHKAQQEDVDEDDAMRQHQQFYGGAGQPHPASSGSMGSAAAMQALKMFNQGGGSSGSGNAPKSQNDFIGLAMSQAAKLFDQQSSQGNVHQSASKQDAISSAAQMALKMYMKSQGGGGGSSGSGLMGLMSKFM